MTAITSTSTTMARNAPPAGPDATPALPTGDTSAPAGTGSGDGRPGPNRRRGRRRLLIVAALVLVGALAAGAAGAYVTLTGHGTGSASTGRATMSLGPGPTTRTCSYAGLAPGDLTGASTCALSVTYRGSMPAYVSLTVAIQSKAGSGGQQLYDGTNTNGLTLSISDGRRAFTVPVGAGSTGGSCPAGFTCWTAANELSAWYSGSKPNLAFVDGRSVTWTVTPLFPRTAGNPFQGASAAVTLTAQAVQAPANRLPAGCTTSTIGQSCPASGRFVWS